MKKGMRVFVSSILTIGILFINTMNTEASQYPDVKKGSWYYSYVMDVSDRGIMTGYNNGRFGATDRMTRGQFATILWRMSGAPNVGYDGRYPDVSGSVFYATASKWASDTGVITGFKNGKFGGNEAISREQVATILHHYTKGEASGNIWSFPDGGRVSEFARAGMSYAVGNNIITGDKGCLNPQGSVSRAVAATMISRLSINTGNGGDGGNTNGDNLGDGDVNNNINGGNTDDQKPEVSEYEKWEFYDGGALTERNRCLDGLTYCGGSKYPVVAPTQGIDWDNDIKLDHIWRSKNTDVTVYNSFAPWEGDLDGAEPPDQWGSPSWQWSINNQGLSLQEWINTYLELEYYYELHDPYVRDSHIRLGIDGEYEGPNGEAIYFKPGEHPFIHDQQISDEEVANRQLKSGSGYPSVTLSDVTNPPVEGAVLVRNFDDGYVEAYTGGFLVSYDIYGGTGQWANYMLSSIPDSNGNVHGGSRLNWAVKNPYYW